MMKVCLLRNRSVLKRGSCGAGRNVVNTYRIVRPTWFVNEAPKVNFVHAMGSWVVIKE